MHAQEELSSLPDLTDSGNLYVFYALKSFYESGKKGPRVSLSPSRCYDEMILSSSSLPRDKTFALLVLYQDGSEIFPEPSYDERIMI